MKIVSAKAQVWLGMASLLLAAAAQAQAQAPQSMSAMVGDYDLVSSTTAPAGNWKFTKARLAVTQLDDHHLLIRMGCEWKTSPKEGCDEWWAAQMRNGVLYLQDTNTDNMTMRFDPGAHTLTIATQGYDEKATVRTDVFHTGAQPTTDAALIRRLKTAQSSFDGSQKSRSFGRYNKWEYTRAQIPFDAK